MTEPPHDEPQEKKIIIDEDWKSRAESEKEELQRKQQEKNEETAPAGPEADVPLPAPSLGLLANSLGMQAMIAMGLMSDPASEKPQVRLNQAQHLIDTIAMLEEKTNGNRTPEETTVLNDLLHELRLTYVAVRQRQGEG